MEKEEKLLRFAKRYLGSRLKVEILLAFWQQRRPLSSAEVADLVGLEGADLEPELDQLMRDRVLEAEFDRAGLRFVLNPSPDRFNFIKAFSLFCRSQERMQRALKAIERGAV